MIKVLLLADTHLGFDLPSRPRVDRRRRGPDFFASTRSALSPALAGEVDLVVHGGDLRFRSKVRPGLVALGLEPLLEVADRGVPVVLVPGNHERSALPYPLLAAHEHLHVLDRPRTVRLNLAGTRVAVGGFPCERIEGELSPGSERVLRAEALRTLHPPSMTVVVRQRGTGCQATGPPARVDDKRQR